MRLNRTFISKLSYDPAGSKLQRHWDDSMPGMAVEAFKTGKKSFVYRYRIGGKQKFLTIGDVLTTDLEHARDEAYRFSGLVRKGEDPKLSRGDGQMSVDALIIL